MVLHQINLAYVPAEDRVLMRINTDDRSELGFWLTRRVFIELNSALSRAQSQMAGSIHSDVGDTSKLQAMQQFEQATLAAAGNFSSDFTPEAASYPLGKTPVLVTKVGIKVEAGLISGAFELATDQTITINFDLKLAAGFSKLLGDLVKSCQWDIPGTPVSLASIPFFALDKSNTVH